jgi:hypothetical protein
VRGSYSRTLDETLLPKTLLPDYQMFSLDTIIEQKMKAKVEKSQN